MFLFVTIVFTGFGLVLLLFFFVYCLILRRPVCFCPLRVCVFAHISKTWHFSQLLAVIFPFPSVTYFCFAATGINKRPSSAIYPSESFRQPLLGSRLGRSSLMLSKSVSTNNIVGWVMFNVALIDHRQYRFSHVCFLWLQCYFQSGWSVLFSKGLVCFCRTLNDDSPLGLRRILSQSTDSLSFRARAMSIESLADEGITSQGIITVRWWLIPSLLILVCQSLLMNFCSTGDQYYSSVLDEIECEGQDFKADSWSMAVDSSYLQMHRKDVIKRQDVIYGDNIIFLLLPEFNEYCLSEKN